MNATELKQHMEIIRELLTLDHFEGLTLNTEICGKAFAYDIWTEFKESGIPAINVKVTRTDHSGFTEQILDLELTPDDFLTRKFFPKDDSDSRS